MITIFAGEPGAGKTSLLSALAVNSMTTLARERLKKCNSIINVLNDNGYHYNYPKEHITYTNFWCRSKHIKWFTPRTAYDFDGTDFGLEDPEHETKNIFPCSFIFFMEGQSFLNSRASRYFRDSVSRAYENHRHWGLDIFIDAQRGTLIDINVREISGEIINVIGREILRDKMGRITEIKWNTQVFQASSTYEKYLETGKLEGEFETRVYSFPGNIHDCYESENNFALFLAGREDKMFWDKEHEVPSYTKEYIEKYAEAHSILKGYDNGYWNKPKPKKGAKENEL